tara:strand:- start:934 stop:1143 length:210 start_codon:yes stop_codon:yes gene_type:complete
MKNEFNKGELVEVTKDLDGPIKDTPKGMIGFVLGFRSHTGPYNQSWYDVHLADGRTLMMLDNWFKKVNK